MADENEVNASISLGELGSRQKSGFRVFRPVPGQTVLRRDSVYAAQPLASPAQSPYSSSGQTLPELGEDMARLPCSPLSTGGKSPACTNPTSPNCFFNGSSPSNRTQRRSITTASTSARRRSVNLTPLKINGVPSSTSSYRLDSSPSSACTPPPIVPQPSLDTVTPRLRRISVGSPLSSPSRSPLSSALPNVPNSLVDFLDGMPWLDGAPLDIKTKVAQAAQVRPVHQGEVVIRKGEIAKAIFFVARGIVEVISEDSEVVYAELGEGSIFGEIGILFDRPRTCSCRAATSLLLLSVKKDSFLPILGELPELKERILKEATERLRILSVKTKSLNTTNAMGKDFAISSMAEYLLSFPLFSRLDRQTISQISLLMESASYKQAEEISCSTKTGSYETVYFVLQGDVEISTYPTVDCETALAVETASAGTFFGDLAAFHPDEPMPEDELFTRVFRAAAACEVLKLPSASLRKFLGKNNEIAYILSEEIESPTHPETFTGMTTHLDYEDPIIGSKESSITSS